MNLIGIFFVEGLEVSDNDLGLMPSTLALFISNTTTSNSQAVIIFIMVLGDRICGFFPIYRLKMQFLPTGMHLKYGQRAMHLDFAKIGHDFILPKMPMC